ncbi:MAG: hypothetical protein NC350_02045 [Corallococcus sp.]|nr:hypothetical protein [Corallococcus sp.]
MYEVTLSVDNGNDIFLKQIEKSLAEVLTDVDGAQAYKQCKNRSYLSLACSDTYKKPFEDYLTDTVTEVLSIGYKNVYLREKLRVDSNDFLTNTLINTMCVFDNSFDKQFIRKILRLDSETVCLDGYYNFRLKKLKDKWHEIVSLVSGNEIILSDIELMKEFLSYLLEAIPSTVKNLSVVMNKNNVQFFDSKNRLIKCSDVAFDATPEEKAMINIICLKPCAVKLYCKASELQNGFIELTQYLFDTKLMENS